MKFYKRDPDRALSGMAELTLKQRGAYNSIIDLLYSRDGEVDDDDVRVARMICCHWREWKAVKLELIALGKLWLEGGKIRARRVQETIKEASDFAQDQSRRASYGWQKRRSDNQINGALMPPGNTSTATPIATVTVRKKQTLSAGAADADPDFDQFWKAYAPPKNSKKPDARKAWGQTAKARPPIADLLRAVAGYNSWIVDEGRKQKREYPKQMAATWLRGEMWGNFLDGSGALTPEQIAINMDRADQLMRRGKYSETAQ